MGHKSLKIPEYMMGEWRDMNLIWLGFVFEVVRISVFLRIFFTGFLNLNKNR